MNIKFILSLPLIIILFNACANTQYVNQMVEIENAKQAGRISEAEY